MCGIIDGMTKETLSPKPEQPAPRHLPAVECSRGHWNDPYPDNGKCVECGVYLPANPAIFTAETAAEASALQDGGSKSREEIAHRVLEDEGVPWDDATEGLRQLALQFAKSKNTKTLELILQQIGVLKAKPKPGEEKTELKYEVTLAASTVAELEHSLAVLKALL